MHVTMLEAKGKFTMQLAVFAKRRFLLSASFHVGPKDDFENGLRCLSMFVRECYLSMCPIGTYMCHRARLGWSGTSGLRQNRGTSTHKGR